MSFINPIYILTLLTIINGLNGIDKYRIFSVKKSDQLSMHIMLRCPLAWSEDDTIIFSGEISGLTIPVQNYGQIKDSMVVDVSSEKTLTIYQCTVTHKADGSQETAKFLIDKENKYRDIQRLNYSWTSTEIMNAELNTSLTITCNNTESKDKMIWFGPDLLQLNHTLNTLTINAVKLADFGSYFCGENSNIIGTTLLVKRIVVKLPTVSFNALNRNTVDSTNIPNNPLGESMQYASNRGFTITRRVIWEQPIGSVLLNQGRYFYVFVFTPEYLNDEFFNQITDRNDLNFQYSNKVLFHSLEMAKKTFAVNIYPNNVSTFEDTAVEFLCNNTYNYRVIWTFKSLKFNEVTDLPKDVIIRHNILNSTLTINTVKSIHKGTYYCDAKKDVASAVLNVLPKPNLLVTPIEIVVRPGSSARFLCQLIGASGTVIWRREDKKSFQVDLESRIGGDTQALLIVSSVTKAMNGTVYECLHNDLLTKATLIVKDLCPTKQRACLNSICIDENKFCNGIKDCEDGFDEEINTCAQCEPNQFACKAIREKLPHQKCIANHWRCDGENDCGNGYDELNCIKWDKNTCLSSHFACDDNVTLIPRSSWCDESSNCPNGEDEKNCRDPEVIIPSQETTYVVHANSSISLKCEVVSVPTATINWRFNWGSLPQQLNFTIYQTGTDCNRITNVLTINNMNPDFAGVYSCEALSNKRAMAKDYTIFVTSQILCKKPFFNNAAMFVSMCLKCFCSGQTDDCTSAIGYYQSPVPKISTRTKGLLMNYKSQKILEVSYAKSIYDVSSKSYKFIGKMYEEFVVDPTVFLTSDFGMSGSWLESYSFFLTINMKLFGNSKEDIRGPKVILQNVNGKSLYWCTNDNSDVVYSTPEGFYNQLKISLWEKENWFIDKTCEKSAMRSDILHVLSDIKYLLVRIKYYSNQTGFEFFNATVDYTIATSDSVNSNIYAPRIEKCNCPAPYTGLSCEKCLPGYEKTNQNQCVKKCPLNCKECDINGNCNRCHGQRSGPKCLDCKSGFVRLYGEKLSSDCMECNCNSQLNNTLISNICMRDLTGRGAIVCKCTGRERNDPVCDKCLQKPLSIVDERDCKNRNQSENENCNSIGTKNIIDRQCECKENFKGPTCSECVSGYFSYQNKCLKCFCSNKTQECKDSDQYRFVNLTLNSAEIKLDVVLTNRLMSGVYEYQITNNHLLVNRTENTIFVKRNPNDRGLVYVTLKLSNSTFPNDIHKYTMLYGGKISFLFEYMTDQLNDLVFSDVTPFIEIESKKFGRLWSVMSYNEQTKTMESIFMEDYFPKWRIGKEGKLLEDRETFIRALMTAQYLSVGFPFDNELVENVRLRDLTIEHATWMNDFGKIAPVEICLCPKNSPGFKCEACNKIGYQNVISVSPNLPDIVCGQCDSPDCVDCKEGTYKFDFVLNKNFSTCQLGIEMITKGRIIYVNKDENLQVPCTAKSYRGGIAIHQWNKLSEETTYFNVTHEMTEDKSSNLILNFKRIQLSDGGLYVCEAVNSVSNSSEEFFIIVEDKPSRLSLNISVTTIDKVKTQVNVTVDSPQKPTDYKIVWYVVKDGKKDLKETSSKISVTTENKVYKIDIEVPTNVTSGVKLKGIITGNRVENPFHFVLDQNIKRNLSIKPEQIKISVDKPVIELKFLESARIRVLVDPKIRTETFWYKVNEDGSDIALPNGISKDENDLLIWSAADNHNGRYIGYIVNTDEGTKIGIVETVVKVAPMIPDVNKDIFNTTETKNASISLYVPDPIKCPSQSWELVDLNRKAVDITHLVKRISDKEVVIDHELSIGQVIRFRCSVIPEIDIKGKIKITIDSKFPVVEIKKNFETSVYPVSMECRDNNTAYPSSVVWYFKEKPVDKNLIIKTNSSSTINWKIIGGFSLGLHQGIYTCRINNSFNSASKSVPVPDSKTAGSRHSKYPGSINVTSSTNPVFKQQGALSIFVTKNQRLEITAELFGNPANNSKLEWRVNGKLIEPTSRSKYYSKLVIPQVKDKDQLGIYEITVKLENGTVISRKVEIAYPKETSIYLKVDGINPTGNMTILEGDTQSIRCNLIKLVKGEEVEITDANIVWKMKTSMGRQISVSELPGFTKEITSKELKISKANRTLNSYIGQCTAAYENNNYESRFIFFDVNQRNIDMKVRLLGLIENKYISNVEEDTSQVICQAYDARSNRVLPGVKYSWNMTQKNNVLNWKILIEDNDKITFGGLIYHPMNISAVGICLADYFNTILYSEPFTFKVLKKDRYESPQISVNVIYDPENPPYPVAVVVQDSRPNSTSNVTLKVINKNFDQKKVLLKPGLIVVNFTTNNTKFNPYYDSGLYTFTATNNFGTDSKAILLPQHNNTNNKFPAVLSVFATSPVINDKIRIQERSVLKIICAYYGHPYPINLKWVPESEDQFNGVTVDSSDYYTSLVYDKFDRKRNSGTYKCEALSHQGPLTKKVQIEGYDYGVEINLLSENGEKLPDTINKRQGENIVFFYKATDLTNNSSFTKSTGIWEFRYAGAINFSSIDNEKPKETIEISGNKIFIREVSVTKPVEIRLRIRNGTSEYVSKTVVVHVIENENLHPNLVFEIEYSKENRFYPQKLFCNDKTSVPSKVQIFKDTEKKNDKVNVYSSPNQGTLDWNSHPFSPFFDLGIYKCIGTNRYKQRVIYNSFPEKIDIATPKDEYVQFESRINEIKIENKKSLDIINGSKLLISCSYFGSQAPTSDVEIVYESKSGDLFPINKPVPFKNYSSYYASVFIDEFDANTQSGKYVCRSRNATHSLMDKLIINGIIPGISVTVKGLDKNNNLQLTQGSNTTLLCFGIDTVTKTENNTFEYKWLIEDSHGKQINIETLSEFKVVDKGVLSLTIVKPNKNLRGRCEVTAQGKKYYSTYFGIFTNEDTLRKPKVIINYKVDEKTGIVNRLECLDLNGENSNITVKFLSGLSTDIKVNKKKGSVEFLLPTNVDNPLKFIGSYECKAESKFGTDDQIIHVKYTPIYSPIMINITSKSQSILMKSGMKYIKSSIGSVVEIDCSYAGGKPPILAEWYFGKNSEMRLLSREDSTHQYKVFNKRSDILSIRPENFTKVIDLNLTCIVKDGNGNLSSDSINVMYVKPIITINVTGLNSESIFLPVQGSNRKLVCSIKETESNKDVSKNFQFDWYFQTQSNQRFPIQDLAENVTKNGGELSLITVKNPRQVLYAQCHVNNGSVSDKSNPFFVNVDEDESKKPRLFLKPMFEQNFFTQLDCIDRSEESSNMTFDYLNGTLSGGILKRNRNYIAYVLDSKSSLKYDGIYRCNATSKYGSDSITLDTSIKPVSNLLIISLSSKDVNFIIKDQGKIAIITDDKTIEIDCLYDGGQLPIDVTWYRVKDSQEIELVKNEITDHISVNQNQPKALTAKIMSMKFTPNLSLKCVVKDANGVMKSSLVNLTQSIPGVKFVVTGLDKDSNFYPKQGSVDRKLKASILDSKTDKDLSGNFKIKWYFLKSNKEEYPINNLADKVEEKGGEISFISMKNPQQVLTAQCFATNGTHNYTSPGIIVNVEHDVDKQPKLHFNKTIGDKSDFPEKLFCMNERTETTEISIGNMNGKSIPKEWIKKTENSVTVMFPVEENLIFEYLGTYYCFAENKYGTDKTTLTLKGFEPLSITVNSTINDINQERSNISRLSTSVRSNRKLQLDCYATGEPNVQIQWFIFTEKYVPDVPIPSRKVLLNPNEGTQNLVQKITNKHYRLTRDHFSQDSIDSFQCEVKLKSQSMSQNIKINEIKDIFKVNIETDQGGLLRQQVFVDKPLKIWCKMENDKKEPVKIKKVNWIFTGSNRESIPIDKLAKTVNITKNKLILTDISQNFGDQIRSQCVAYYNDSYDVISNEISLDLAESPKIYSIYFKQIFPVKKLNLLAPYNLTYDALKKTRLECIAIVSKNAEAKITWLKCSDQDCKTYNETSSSSYLFFPANSTKHVDVGQYRCLVKLQLLYKEILNQTATVYINRFAPPRSFAMQTMNLKISNKLVLACLSDFNSPEGNITWSFIPRGKSQEESIPKEANTLSPLSRLYHLSIRKPLKREYEGLYICRVTNEYGIGEQKYNVTISGS